MHSGKKSGYSNNNNSSLEQKSNSKSIKKQKKIPLNSVKTSLKIGQKITSDGVVDLNKTANPKIIAPFQKNLPPPIENKQESFFESQIQQMPSSLAFNFPSYLEEEKPNPPINATNNQSILDSQDILQRMIEGNQLEGKDLQKKLSGGKENYQVNQIDKCNKQIAYEIFKDDMEYVGANQNSGGMVFSDVRFEGPGSNLSLSKKRSIKINQGGGENQIEQNNTAEFKDKNNGEFTFQMEDQKQEVWSKKQIEFQDFSQNQQKGIINERQSIGEKKEIVQKINFSLQDSLVVKKNGNYQNEYEDAKQDCSQKDGKKLIMLGRGGFGQVFLVRKRGTNEERAMKIVLKRYQEAYREVMMLKKFQHPNVLKIYEYYEDEQSIYVITERCYGYNLFDYIIHKGQFDEQQTCKIADGILRALSEAHKQGIVHRDVKPDNIMLDFNDARDSFIVKLIDWGLAEQIPQGENRYLTKRCGTLHYLAPEVLAKRYNEKIDLWSLGMVLFTLIQGSPPICGRSQQEILQTIQGYSCQFEYFCWKNISDDAKDLILKLLERDPTKRISSNEALHHPWFNNLNESGQINTQDLKLSFNNLSRYAQQNTFKKTVLGFFASHTISKREKTKYIEIFQALDTDKNGELSIEELQKGFSKLFDFEENNICHYEIEQIFYQSLSSRFENADGIKYEEFLSSMLACSATYSQEQLFDAFKIFDKDGNGRISLQEIVNTLGIRDNVELVQCFKEIIDQFDANQDGQIDFEEFSQIMTNFVEKHSQVILSQEIYLQ